MSHYANHCGWRFHGLFLPAPERLNSRSRLPRARCQRRSVKFPIPRRQQIRQTRSGACTSSHSSAGDHCWFTAQPGIKVSRTEGQTCRANIPYALADTVSSIRQTGARNNRDNSQNAKSVPSFLYPPHLMARYGAESSVRSLPACTSSTCPISGAVNRRRIRQQCASSQRQNGAIASTLTISLEPALRNPICSGYPAGNSDLTAARRRDNPRRTGDATCSPRGAIKRASAALLLRCCRVMLTCCC